MIFIHVSFSDDGNGLVSGKAIVFVELASLVIRVAVCGALVTVWLLKGAG
jgi:hypothetical protein